MFGGWLRRTGFLLSFGLVLSGFAAAAPACADESGAGFKLRAENTQVSPDHQLRIEQYSKDMGDDESFLHQFWAFDDKHMWKRTWSRGWRTITRGWDSIGRTTVTW